MDADHYHRLLKAIADSGEAATIDDAVARFSQFGVTVDLGDAEVLGEADQIIALTIINAASRSFRGNVALRGRSDMPLTVRGYAGCTIATALASAGAVQTLASDAWSRIAVGPQARESRGAGAIAPWADGWTFGIGDKEGSPTAAAAASVAAAGLAVSEAFSILRKDNVYAGKRNISMSLWSAVGGTGDGPRNASVPACWLIGLGHLGQAAAWTLGFMSPGPDRTVVLQDVDHVTASTLSTSMLSAESDQSRSKARVTADWLEHRGHRTKLVERRFDASQRVHPLEPRIALFGVDNTAARRAIESAGFALAIDVGLGAGYQDFRGIRVRTFPGSSRAAHLWAGGSQAPVSMAPAYQALLASGADACGVTTLASRAVGAPFVGCVAAALGVAALLQASEGGTLFSVIDLNLRNPDRMVSA